MSLNKIGIYIERNTKSEYRKYTIYKVTLYLKTIANLQNLTIANCKLNSRNKEMSANSKTDPAPLWVRKNNLAMTK